MFYDLLNALEETLFMVFAAGISTCILGLPLGVILFLTRAGQLKEHPLIHKILSMSIQATHSVPYIILMIALIPFTRYIIGTGEGIAAALIPLTLAATPFFARMTDESIQQLPNGLTEAALASGASAWQVIYKVLIPEASPGLVKGMTLTLVHLVGYSAIAGALGAGGLGSLAIYKGYYAFQSDYVLSTVVLLIVLVRLIQACGDYVVHGTFKQQAS